jgi:hypothetical protein
MYTDLHKHFILATFPDLRDAGTGQRVPAQYWGHGDPGNERTSRGTRDRAGRARGRFGRRGSPKAIHSLRSW